MRAKSSLIESFGRVTEDERVHSLHDDEDWWGVRDKGYYMVGRTIWGRRCVWSLREVEALCVALDYDAEAAVRGWSSLGVAQRLDHVATEILRRDREQRTEQQRQAGRTFSYETIYLSPGQWYARLIREIPTPVEGMVALMEFAGDRAHLYRGGVPGNDKLRARMQDA